MLEPDRQHASQKLTHVLMQILAPQTRETEVDVW